MSKDEKLDYPAEFVAAVAAEWPPPNDKVIPGRLAEGDPKIGALLAQASEDPFTPQEVVKFLEAGQGADLLSQAQRRIRLGKLFEQWLKIVQPSTPSPRRSRRRAR